MTPSIIEFAALDVDGGAISGLKVQSAVGLPPDYADVLYRLYLVPEQDTTVLLDGQKTTLKANHMLTLSPGEQVAFPPDSHLISCAFHHDFFCVRVMRHEVFCDGVVFNRLRGLPVVNLTPEGAKFAQTRFHELRHVIEDGSLFKLEHAINILRSLLLQVADCKIRHADPSTPNQVSLKKVSSVVARFQDLVEENYVRHLDVSAYSDMLGVTIATLNRHVKSELGQTPKQVAQERLAIEARVALRAGNRSIKDVAFELGFDDPLYFSRFFRKQFGMAPTQYFSGHI